MGSLTSRHSGCENCFYKASKFVYVDYTWTIDRFSCMQEDEILRSPSFSSKDHGELKWHLELWPTDRDPDDKACASLHLFLDSCKGNGVRLLLRVSLMNDDAEPVEVFATKKPRRFFQGGNAGFRTFTTLGRLLSLSGNNSGDRLIVRCEALVAMDKETARSNRSPREPVATEIPSDSAESGYFSAHKAIPTTRYFHFPLP